MANREEEHTLDNILPEREDSYESFYEAINSSVLLRNSETYDSRKSQSTDHKKKKGKD